MSEDNKKITIEVDRLTFWRAGTIIFAFLFVISIFTGGFGIGNESSGSGTAPSAPSAPSAPGVPAPTAAAGDVDIEGNYFKGDEDADVVLVEFSDFQCPFCSRFYSQTLGQIESEYIDSGKVKLVYKDFPLDSIHPEARPASNAARCAGEQGKFWEYHDLLFENQQSLSDSSYKNWASDLSLDTSQFNSCLDNSKYDAQVTKDFNDGSGVGVRGTPGFVVIDKSGNGRLISGAQPFSSFQSAIEAALSS
jgi:protein-disulfide isomerase